MGNTARVFATIAVWVALTFTFVFGVFSLSWSGVVGVVGTSIVSTVIALREGVSARDLRELRGFATSCGEWPWLERRIAWMVRLTPQGDPPMKSLPALPTLTLCALALGASTATAQVVMVEPGHTLVKIVDSVFPLDPSQTLFETLTPLANIEGITFDPGTGDLYVQLIEPGLGTPSATTHIYQITPAGVVTPISLFTGFGTNERGTDLHFDPINGVLLTQDENVFPSRIATVSPLTGAIGTYSFLTPPVFTASTFGMDISLGAGGSDVPFGDVVFTSDLSAAGIHSAAFGGAGSFTHVPASVTGPADDMVIQPDGDWVWFGDSGAGIWNYSPMPPHPGVFSGLDVAAMFGGAGLPFLCGTRATVCDTTGDSYVTWSCFPGANGIFRVDEALTTSTLLLTAGLATGAEGIQDLVVGPSTLGAGESLFFTIHNLVTGGEEVWEMTTLGCCANPPSVAVRPGLGLNAPFSLTEFPLGNLPTVGNAGYAQIVDDPIGICGIPPGTLTALALSTAPAAGPVLPGFGCPVGAPGEFLIATGGLNPFLISVAPWIGPGAGAVHPLPIPLNIALCGFPIFTQGIWAVTAPPAFVLTEALDIVIGS